MGTGSFTDQDDGEVADAVDVQQLIDALKENFVPRNLSGVPNDGAGSLGSSIYPWLKLFLGLSAEGISVETDNDDFIVKIDSTEVFRLSKTEAIFKPNGAESAKITTNGIDVTSFPTTGVLPQLKKQTFNSSGTFNIPDDVSRVIVQGVGGGGGGGGGGNSTTGVGGGGGGGCGSAPYMTAFDVTPGGTLSVVIGSGGSGGTNETNGSNGGDSSVGTVKFWGAPGGTAGSVSNSAGNGFAALYNPGDQRTAGGDGGGNGTGTGLNGQSGGHNNFYNGGAAGLGLGVNGGSGGGGGGAGFNGNGGAGANGGGNSQNGLNAANATARGAGGGGGGGAGIGSFTGGAGGDGGNGQVEIYYISHL